MVYVEPKVMKNGVISSYLDSKSEIIDFFIHIGTDIYVYAHIHLLFMSLHIFTHITNTHMCATHM